MTLIDLLVLGGSALFLAVFYGWFFFTKPSRPLDAKLNDSGVQEMEIVVKGGYTPALITAKQGVPLRLLFKREEEGECTARVLIPAFKINRELPAFATTAIELRPDRKGEFEFVCGMGMVHGKIIVS